MFQGFKPLRFRVESADFFGTIQCDGYGVCPAYQKGNDQVSLMACLAHIRRNFIETLDAGPDQGQGAARIVRLIAHLYSTEKDLRESKAGPSLRESERAWRAAPIVARIKATMKVLLTKHRPKSLMGKALAYGLRHLEHFAGYLVDGRLEMGVIESGGQATF